MDNKIDFVVTWVDGGDPSWQADKAKYSSAGADTRNARYRDWDQLKYWFRAVEKNAPWVNKIHFVTYGHLPNWLDTSHPKLNIVNHKDFIPEQFLPVFNSTAIEVHLHRIPNLSEHFVYFCDDFYLMQPCKPSDFFQNGKPADMPRLVPVLLQNNDMYYYHLYNDYSLYRSILPKKNLFPLLVKYTNPKYGKVAVRNLFSLLAKNIYFFPLHLPMPLLKKTMEDVWNMYPDELERTASSKFRQMTNNSPELFRGYQLITGNFHPINRKGIILNTKDVEKACNVIKDCRYKYMCLSDTSMDDDFEKHRDLINEAFDIAFPALCAFENKFKA